MNKKFFLSIFVLAFLAVFFTFSKEASADATDHPNLLGNSLLAGTGCGQIDMYWLNSDGVEYYDIYRAINSSNFSDAVPLAINTHIENMAVSIFGPSGGPSVHWADTTASISGYNYYWVENTGVAPPPQALSGMTNGPCYVTMFTPYLLPPYYVSNVSVPLGSSLNITYTGSRLYNTNSPCTASGNWSDPLPFNNGNFLSLVTSGGPSYNVGVGGQVTIGNIVSDGDYTITCTLPPTASGDSRTSSWNLHVSVHALAPAAGPVCNSSSPGACQGLGATAYEYDFFSRGTQSVGASFRGPHFIREFSPSNLPMPNFQNFISSPGLPVLSPCNLDTYSSGELDCLSPNPHGGQFQFNFNYGHIADSLGSFTGSGWEVPDHSVPSHGTVFLENGVVRAIAGGGGADPLCSQVKVTWTYGGVAESFKIYKDGTYVGSTNFPDEYFIYNSGRDALPQTYSVSAVSSGSESTHSVWSGNPVAGNPCAGPATVTLDNSTCGQMTINWASVGGAASYNIYRNTTGNPPSDGDLLLGGINGTNYSDTSPPSSSAQPYYYFVSGIVNSNETAATAAGSNPKPINYCTVNLGDSDINIVAINGTMLYTHPPLPNGAQCDSSTDALPAGVTLYIGDVLTFSLNLCNDQGTSAVSLSGVTSPMINLIRPKLYSDFEAYYNLTPLIYDGPQSSSYAPGPNHYFASGSEPNQMLVFNLSGNSIPAHQVVSLTYQAQLSVPADFKGLLSRFQNGFGSTFVGGTGPDRHTPLLPFQLGTPSPSIKEGR